MLSHDHIWLAIDRLAEQLGYSPSGLARRAGLDPTAFNRSKRLSPEGKPRWPSTESLAKVLTVTGTSMGQFVLLVGEIPAEDSGGAHPALPAPSRHDIPVVPIDVIPRALDRDGHLADMGWSRTTPELLLEIGDDTLAIEITDSRFSPVYSAGDVLIVSPHAPLRRGDRVLAVMDDGRGVMVGRYLRRTAQYIEITDVLGQNAIAVPPRALRMLARIVLATQ